ncbi:hypothetical protein V8J88_15400 [Massilia sp. W12]|uniref:hypothetical protein n=1 Tax=Massilia sp. W12 TaxID=3126507 RepID=UPI0030D3DEFE
MENAAKRALQVFAGWRFINIRKSRRQARHRIQSVSAASPARCVFLAFSFGMRLGDFC